MPDYIYIFINSYLPILVALVLGLFIGRITKTKSKSSVLTGSSDEQKLNNEVLKDQVKQLESKIKTLEKALEITSKN